MVELSRPDLCIVGAGALGLALARHARQLGASVLLVDRGAIEPGDGPDAALRLAALRTSAAQALSFRQGASFGLANVDPKPSFKAIQERMRRIASEHAPADSPDRLAALGIETITGETRFTGPQTLAVGERQIRAGTLILAVGASPQVPPVPGLDQIETFTADSILDVTRKLSHLLVIGDDPSAYVLAQAFVRLGSTVTLVPQGPALSGYDVEARAILLAALDAEGVRIIDGGNLAAIHPRSQGIGATVTLLDEATEALDVSHVLVATAGVADLAPLDPGAARLRPRREGGSLVQGELGETNNRRIRIVGAAAGIEQWHHGLRHGCAVVESVVLGAPRSRVGAQPRLVLTEPALAEVGHFPQNAAGIFRASFAENEMALATGQGRGLVKVVTRQGGMIDGASLVGPGAAELAGVLALAIERAIPLDALADLSLPHPSLFSTITALGETYLASRTDTPWTARRRALRRIIPFGG